MMRSMTTEKRHRVLREVLRHFLTFEDWCKQNGQYQIEHAGLTLSFLDLQDCLQGLSERKMQAVWMNVVLDMKQKDVADIMGIRTVTVGQYVDQAFQQIAVQYFSEMEMDDTTSQPTAPDGMSD